MTWTICARLMSCNKLPEMPFSVRHYIVWILLGDFPLQPLIAWRPRIRQERTTRQTAQANQRAEKYRLRSVCLASSSLLAICAKRSSAYVMPRDSATQNTTAMVHGDLGQKQTRMMASRRADIKRGVEFW